MQNTIKILHFTLLKMEFKILHFAQSKLLSFDVHFTTGKISYFLKGFALCEMKNFGTAKLITRSVLLGVTLLESLVWHCPSENIRTGDDHNTIVRSDTSGNAMSHIAISQFLVGRSKLLAELGHMIDFFLIGLSQGCLPPNSTDLRLVYLLINCVYLYERKFLLHAYIQLNPKLEKVDFMGWKRV